MTDLIETDRFRLRRPVSGDALEMSRLIDEWAVIKWLSKPPFPYSLSDAEGFIGGDASNGCFCIEVEGAFAGVVGLTDAFDLGYWLGQPFHRRGYMTEAAMAVVDDHFGALDDPITSGYFLNNDASCNVLSKCGFVDTAITSAFSIPRNKYVEVQRMELTKENWQALHG